MKTRIDQILPSTFNVDPFILEAFTKFGIPVIVFKDSTTRDAFIGTEDKCVFDIKTDDGIIPAAGIPFDINKLSASLDVHVYNLLIQEDYDDIKKSIEGQLEMENPKLYNYEESAFPSTKDRMTTYQYEFTGDEATYKSVKETLNPNGMEIKYPIAELHLMIKPAITFFSTFTFFLSEEKERKK